ncbi:hypothetical protein Pcinc_021448 [Petrolisthes cinctipes]|uniref:Uncharacterized protein n=1 Tax=Petrolisthes cinctipes TaxID=88211 RepID=A0AAE1KF23_PETCI|nr:hypothetical protein Pcinc_021448 [Petrolisthes cinctipes]
MQHSQPVQAVMMESKEVGHHQRSGEGINTCLEWDQLDSLSVQATRIHRSLTEQKERCLCNEELISKEDTEATQLKSELQSLELSTSKQAMNLLQQSATETNLQSSLEVMRKQISHEDKENQGLLENLEDLNKKMEGAQQKYQAHLQAIRLHYGDRLVDSDKIEFKKKLQRLENEKNALTSRLANLKLDQKSLAMKEWESFTKSVITLAELAVNYRNKLKTTTQLRNHVKILESRIMAAREEVQQHYQKENEVVTQSAMSSGIQENIIGQADSHVSMQQHEIRANPSAVSQNTSDLAQWSTHRSKQFYSAAITQDRDDGNKHYMTPNTPNFQSWNTQKLQQSSPLTHHRLSSPQFKQNFSSSLSQLKLQFPKFSGIKRNSQSPMEVTSRQDCSVQLSSPATVTRASFAPLWPAPPSHTVGHSSHTNQDNDLQITSKSQGNLMQSTNDVREKESLVISKKPRCVLEAGMQADIPANSVRRPTQLSSVNSYTSKYSNVRKVLTDMRYMRKENTPSSVTLPRLENMPNDTISSTPLTLVTGSMPSQQESSLNVTVSSQKEISSNSIMLSQVGTTANGTKASQLEVTTKDILSSQHEPTSGNMSSPTETTPSSIYSGLVASKSNSTPLSRQRSIDDMEPLTLKLSMKARPITPQSFPEKPTSEFTDYGVMSEVYDDITMVAVSASGYTSYIPTTSSVADLHSRLQSGESDKSDTEQVESPLNSSQGFSLTDTAGDGGQETLNLTQSADMTVSSSICTAQPGEPIISSSLASTADTSDMSYTSVDSVYQGSSLTNTNMYNSSISVIDKVQSKTQPALLSKISEKKSPMFPISTATSQFTTSSSGTPMLMAQTSHLNADRNQGYQIEGTIVEAPELPRTPIMGRNSNNFMFMGEPEESNMRPGALNLFGSPDVSAVGSQSMETSGVNFSLFGSEPESPRSSNNSFFNFNFSNENKSSQSDSPMYFSMFDSSQENSSQEGAGYRLF